jgi:arylsulfatase A-like enzyme
MLISKNLNKIRSGKRNFVKTLCLVLGLSIVISVLPLGMPVTQPQPAQAQGQRMNTLVILVDDLDESAFNLLLNAGKLPNIQAQLIKKGVRFSNSFVAESMCCASRATFLTGRYPHNSGTYNVEGFESGLQGLVNKGIATTDGNEITSVDWFPTWLQAGGYYTGHIGKFMNTNQYGPGRKPGFDFWRFAGGFDARPGMYKVVGDDGLTSYPDVFQTKYFGDSAIEFLRKFPTTGKSSFFLTVAPMAPHVSVQQWVEVEPEDGSFSAALASYQVRGYDAFFDHPDPAIWERRIVVAELPSGEVNVYYRDRKGSTREAAQWQNWDLDNPAEQAFPGTGSEPIVAFNAFRFPDAPNTIRQHLVRGTQANDYTVYYRDIVNGQAGPFSVAGSAADLFPNPKDLPLVGLAIANLQDPPTPGSDIAQYVVHGDDANGYELRSRVRKNGAWQPWIKEFEMWDLNTSAFPIEDLDVVAVGEGKLDYQLIRKKDLSGPRTIYHMVARSSYITLTKPVAARREIPGDMTNPTIFNDEDAQFKTMSSAANPQAQYPHVIWGSRLFADGNWAFRRATQSYAPSLYPGGVLPAGSLRTDGPDGFSPRPGFDVPNLSKANFNHCAGNLPWICQTWPNTSEEVVGGKTQLDYLRRSNLDRFEAMLSVDVMVGQIFQELANKNMLGNTLVIFTSDNGYYQGEHRLGNKIFAYEEGLRVPLVIRPPGSTITNGVINRNTVVNIDLAATILDYASLWNLTNRAKVDGRSLRPILVAKAPQVVSWRKWFLVEHRYPRPEPDLAAGWTWGIPDFRGLRTGVEATDQEGKNHLYVEYTDDPAVQNDPVQYELYDLNVDAFQMTNKQAEPAYQGKKKLYVNLVNGLVNCAGDSCRLWDASGSLVAPTPTSPSKTIP